MIFVYRLWGSLIFLNPVKNKRSWRALRTHSLHARRAPYTEQLRTFGPSRPNWRTIRKNLLTIYKTLSVLLAPRLGNTKRSVFHSLYVASKLRLFTLFSTQNYVASQRCWNWMQLGKLEGLMRRSLTISKVTSDKPEVCTNAPISADAVYSVPYRNVRPISTPRLNVLLRLHLVPINQIISLGT